uniref:BY PROTMAP: gi/472586147/gb/EMS23675.1/ glutaminase GtaA [Rhodosporidium toruloides NP11] gi/647397767/emb/CDR41006.1/ RHTO0S05e10770g1_1 [Rhodosporidium toruloides] n=1 Tax=Rhodotorula toruloides TaxID=5286 RepID=A0A0K3CSY0_RHOTO
MLLRALTALVLAAATAPALPDETDYTPIVVPLAVRSPYLGAYLTGRQDKNLATMDPHFWTTMPLSWKGLLRVDGETWNWMGNLTDWPAAINASVRHTAAETAFTLTNDPPTVALHASFLSPVTPADIFRQFVPFSYLHLTVESLDGQPHEVEAYSEINGLWLADEEDEQIEWEAVERTQEGWTGLRSRLRNQRVFTEAYKKDPFPGEMVSTDRILQGDVWYAAKTPAPSTVRTTFSAGGDAMETRRAFAQTGGLLSIGNSTLPRPIRTRSSSNSSQILDEPVFAFSHSFGRVSPLTPLSHRSALLAIGHVRDPLVRYMAGSAESPRLLHLRPLWASTFHTAEHLLSWFLDDYPTAKEMSDAYNSKLYADARTVEDQEYGHVVAVSTRQVFMALEPVWDESGSTEAGLVAWSPITREPIPAMVMLKEISSNGNVQTVDVITPFLPFLLYSSPTLLPLLLEPIYRYMSTGLYMPTPPAHDLGDHYPNATGHNDFLYPGLPIEEAGNMLALALAGMRVSRPSTAPLAVHQRLLHWWDSVGSDARPQAGWEAEVGVGRDHRREGARMAWAQAREYYPLLKRWAQYLEENSLFPGNQLFGAAPNQTSLVIKGIVGLRSMSEIAHDLGEYADRDYFRGVSERFREQFLQLAVSTDKSHLLGQYNNQSSWVMHYNLYFDRLLFTNDYIFPESIYEMQDRFYPTVAEPFGPPLDSRFKTRTKTDWLAWTASLFPRSSQSRSILHSALARYFRQSKNAVFGDSITPQEGWSVGFLSRPVAGGHYAALGREVMERAWEQRQREQRESESRGAFWATVLGAGGAGTGFVVWRWLKRRNARSGYVGLAGRGEPGGRRGSEGIWLAESPRSVFELDSVDGDDDDRSDEAERRRTGGFNEDDDGKGLDLR